jgi:hypothetical protein
MKAGIMATACAAVPLKFAQTALAQQQPDGKHLNISSDSLIGNQQDMLAYYNKAAFTPYVGTDFLVSLNASKVRAVTLIEVEDFVDPSVQGLPPGEECFSLLFTTPPKKSFAQGTYQVEHPALGKFSLFLVPVGMQISFYSGKQQAVFNRIAVPGVAMLSSGNVVTASEPSLLTRRMEQPIVGNPVTVAVANGAGPVVTFGSVSVGSAPIADQVNKNSAPVQATWLTMAKDSGINGIKLGMTTEQALALFPGSEADEEVHASLSRSANQFGMSSLVIKPQKYSSKEEFAGINQIILSLLDGRVATLYVGYDVPEPEHIDELVTKFSKGRNLPPAGSWAPYTGLDDQLKSMKCKDFEISVFAGGKNVNVNYVQMIDSVAQQKLKRRRAEAKKRMMNRNLSSK